MAEAALQTVHCQCPVVQHPVDEVHCPVLGRFSPVPEQTHCPWAKRAKLQGISQQAGVQALYDLLEQFALNSLLLDGVVLELEGQLTSSQQLRQAIADILYEVCKLNVVRYPEDQKYSCYHLRGAPVTQLRIGGAPFSAMGFGPCIREDEPRFGFGIQSSFILFQSHGAFLRHGFDDAETWTKRAPMVQQMYERHHRGYPASINQEHNPLRKIGMYMPDWYWVNGDDHGNG